MVMVGGPLTGACFNPARWFGAALVSNEWGGVWPYLVGPVVGSLLAVGRLALRDRDRRRGPDRAPAAGRPGGGARRQRRRPGRADDARQRRRPGRPETRLR